MKGIERENSKSLKIENRGLVAEERLTIQIGKNQRGEKPMQIGLCVCWRVEGDGELRVRRRTFRECPREPENLTYIKEIDLKVQELKNMIISNDILFPHFQFKLHFKLNIGLIFKVYLSFRLELRLIQFYVVYFSIINYIISVRIMIFFLYISLDISFQFFFFFRDVVSFSCSDRNAVATS